MPLSVHPTQKADRDLSQGYKDDVSPTTFGDLMKDLTGSSEEYSSARNADMLWMSCLLLILMRYMHTRSTHIIPGLSFFTLFWRKGPTCTNRCNFPRQSLQLFKTLLTSTSVSSSDSSTCYQLGEFMKMPSYSLMQKYNIEWP